VRALPLPSAAGGLWRRVRARGARRVPLAFALLVGPAVLLRLVTAVYPVIETVRLSFTNVNLIGGTADFVGLRNYPALLHDFAVQSAVVFTLAFVLVSTALQMALGLLVALLLNADFRGRTFARTINLLPWAIPTIVSAYVFQWLLDDQFGMFSGLILRVTGHQFAPLISAGGAQTAVILANVWKNAPFMAVVFLAGLQGIQQDVYDAAKVDGAGAWQRFRHVTVPHVAPLATIMGTFFLIWQLGSFDLVYGLTKGGPGVATEVLTLRVFQQGLLFFKFGYASAISITLLVLVCVIGFAALRLFRRVEVTI